MVVLLQPFAPGQCCVRTGGNELIMLSNEKLLSRFDPVTGAIDGATTTKRHLSDLRGCFADDAAFEFALATSNPLVYTVSTVEPARSVGDLHYGVGRLMPGRIGDEYFMTKGHLHARREAAEVYIGVAGKGAMLLENENTGESRLLELQPQFMVYVPGYTVHRTINVGSEPLIYLGFTLRTPGMIMA